MRNATNLFILMDTGTGYHCQITYVLVLPARNEVVFIEQTIKSVGAQSLPPLKWVIVSDGSSDGTDDMILFKTVPQ